MKIKRDAFLYMENPQTPDFAQCSSCWLYAAGMRRCAILGAQLEVGPGATCGYYLEGVYDGAVIVARATPEEVGFISEQVRCENCDFSSVVTGKCNLYVELNDEFPDLFDLDEDIDARGCCNAWDD